MGIALIVVGVILVGAGIFLVTRDSKPEEAVEQMASRSPQERNVALADKSQEKSSKEKGNDFEGYVVDLLSASGVSLKEWNQGTTSPGGTYAENELKPDLFISDSKGSSSLEYWWSVNSRAGLLRPASKSRNISSIVIRSIREAVERKCFWPWE